MRLARGRGKERDERESRASGDTIVGRASARVLALYPFRRRRHPESLGTLSKLLPHLKTTLPLNTPRSNVGNLGDRVSTSQQEGKKVTFGYKGMVH